APIEQYQARTHLGPFTDIYALCATMYAAITGYKPAAAPDRMMGDDVLKPFAAYGLTDVPEVISLHKVLLPFHGKTLSLQ
ncbi:MAG: hypothetical protein IKI37_05325, partial [Oscillospiraceae bacterium]|nr:hypothetical protein [Oscillospiraceae bacterium]